MSKVEYDDCSFCGGQVGAELVDLDYRHEGKPYIFEKVPAGMCRQCGEKYLTAKVAKEIERRLRGKARWQRTIMVPVEEFPTNVPI